MLKALNGRRLKGVDATRTRTVVFVLFDTGMRASEIRTLRTEDVTWDYQTIALREPKGSNQREVSVGAAATRVLMSYLKVRRRTAPWLFAAPSSRENSRTSRIEPC